MQSAYGESNFQLEVYLVKSLHTSKQICSVQQHKWAVRTYSCVVKPMLCSQPERFAQTIVAAMQVCREQIPTDPAVMAVTNILCVCVCAKIETSKLRENDELVYRESDSPQLTAFYLYSLQFIHIFACVCGLFMECARLSKMCVPLGAEQCPLAVCVWGGCGAKETTGAHRRTHTRHSWFHFLRILRRLRAIDSC